MPKTPENAAPLPYADVAAALLGVIYDSLHIIYEARFKGVAEDIIIKRLVERARKLNEEKWAKHQIRNNPHVMDGIPRPKRVERLYDTGLNVPRISRLCLEASHHCYRPGQETDEKKAQGIFIPSPLAILVDVLTTPWRPESYCYGFALARAILFSHFKIHPPTSGLPKEWKSLSISDVQDIIETFKVYALHRDNIHHSKSNLTKVFLAHFLAMNGTFVLRFGTAGKESLQSSKAQAECLEFLRGRQFLTKKPELQVEYEFRLAPGLEDIPDTQEILNNLMGVPLPIAGGPTVFFGGLQQSHHNSLVMSISGLPGTGKTSLALALAASLAPFGTRCLYCTFEEDAETLKRRALGLIPQYFRRTTLLNSGEAEWLYPITLDPIIIKNVKSFSEYVSILNEHLGPVVNRPSAAPDSLPGVAPVLIVIDSLTALLGKRDEEQLEHFCTFLRYLRDLHCIVLLLSAEEIPKDSRLEYLVETVIVLRHEGTVSAGTKPFRLLQLSKSRLQMSRPGAHILHLSGERGLRLSPQLPSQLDSHKIHKTPLADTSAVIETLKVEKVASTNQRHSGKSDRLIDLYPRSKVLIHGHGSSGKAALALKILMAQSVGADTGRPLPVSTYKRPRIFVVSFLYPQEYYEKIFKRLLRISFRGKSPDNAPDVRVLALTPGFTGAEDFISRVLLEMDRGHLEGWPYTGVLLDGLHNTFLQFPLLQGNSIVWPALYSLLSRYDLTIVTTFTTFSKSNSAIGSSKDDEELILQGQLPFLHALVQGTDFHLQVEQRVFPQHDRTFHVTVKSALGQRLPHRALVWDADDLAFQRFETLPSSQPELGLTLK